MKLGLILEGGANRTIFSAGVCDGLLDMDIMADHVTGVSAGIAYGASYVTRQRGRSLEILRRYAGDDRYMGAGHMINPLNGSYFNMEFLFQEIPNRLLPYDYDGLRNYPGTVEAVVTDLRTGGSAFLPLDCEDTENRAILASCALPLMFPIVEVEGVPYMDGGVADPIPIHRALEVGCDRVIVVATRERNYRKKQEKAMAVAARKYRAYPKFVDTLKRRAEIYNHQREELFRLEKQGDVFLYLPYNTEGFSRTEKNETKIHALWQSGYDQARARERELRQYLGGK